MNKPYYLVEQIDSNDSKEYSLNVLARFDYEEDATALIEAKRIAHELELKASSERYPTKYKYFSVWREN